jgi:hypothetical protein
MFTKLARILATLALALGVMRLGIGVYVASIEPKEARDAATASYIGRKTSGEAIDQGIYVILFAVGLGAITEIGRKRPE